MLSGKPGKSWGNRILCLAWRAQKIFVTFFVKVRKNCNCVLRHYFFPNSSPPFPPIVSDCIHPLVIPSFQQFSVSLSLSSVSLYLALCTLQVMPCMLLVSAFFHILLITFSCVATKPSLIERETQGKVSMLYDYSNLVYLNASILRMRNSV